MSWEEINRRLGKNTERSSDVRAADALERIAAAVERALSFYCGKWEVKDGKVVATPQEEPKT